MKFNTDFFKAYLMDAPLPLALERTLECQILSQKPFLRPILDIGCGEGLFAKHLFKEKIDVGIDPNHQELNRAKQYRVYQELIQCKGDAIPKIDGSFNTILSNSVMEHIADIDPVLIEAHRLLSQEGRLYLTLPTARFDQYTFIHQLLKKFKLTQLAEQYSRWFNQFWKHYHYYDTPQWIAKFEQLQFKVVEFHEYGSKKVCLINAMLTPFSIIAFISKQLTNQWFPLTKLRRLTTNIIHPLFKHLSKEAPVQAGKGGLVFFSLKKIT